MKKNRCDNDVVGNLLIKVMKVQNIFDITTNGRLKLALNSSFTCWHPWNIYNLFLIEWEDGSLKIPALKITFRKLELWGLVQWEVHHQRVIRSFPGWIFVSNWLAQALHAHTLTLFLNTCVCPIFFEELNEGGKFPPPKDGVRGSFLCSLMHPLTLSANLRPSIDFYSKKRPSQELSFFQHGNKSDPSKVNWLGWENA